MIRRAQQIATGAGSKLPLLVGLDSVHGANYVQVQIAVGDRWYFALLSREGVVTFISFVFFGHPLVFFEICWTLVLLQLQQHNVIFSVEADIESASLSQSIHVPHPL